LAVSIGIPTAFGCAAADDKTGSAVGGRLVATYRSEPESFNRLVHAQAAVELVNRLTHASLVRLNRVTRTIEPRLAQSWTTSPDGLTWTMKLVEATFSDGTPFTAADVVFSFRAVYDPGVGSPIASSLRVDGQPLTVRALDAHTVVVVFPAPYGPGIAMLDSLPILPAHKLQAALDAQTFKTAWGVTTPLDDLAGLGPFVLRDFVPGQRLVFAKNSRYWRKDDSGRPLPYLDEIEVQIVPDQNGEVVRLQAGQADLMTDIVRAEDIASLRTLERDGKVTLATAGVSISPDALWFNLTSAAPAVKDRPWLLREELRLAISHAVDRRAFVDTVFLGAAEPIFGPITPGHGDWFMPDLPKTEYDPGRAASLLQSIGLQDRNSDGLLEDAPSRPARFTVLTQKGHAIRERSVAVIQEALRKVGLTLDVVAMDVGAMMAKWAESDYDAMYRALNFDSFDPGRNPEFWTSSGSFHLWNPGQPKPSTSWEARIDDLIRQQSRTLDEGLRRKLFADAQRELAAHLPILYFAAPRVTVATSARLRGSMPSILPPPVLWNSEVLSIAR
jgi:peptide/nickel transport system substrate-binding protein